MEPSLPEGQFLGRRVRARQFGKLRLTETAYVAGLSMPQHSHARAHLCLVLDGHYEERFGNANRTRQKSDVLFHPSDYDHAETHLAAGRHLLVELPSEYIQRLTDTGARLDMPTNLSSALTWPLARRFYQEFIRPDDLTPIALEGLTFEIVVQASREVRYFTSRFDPAWIADAVDYLRHHFNRPLDLREVAEVVNVHPVHLAAVFRRAAGCTIGDYLRRLRVEFAGCQLACSDYPLAAIATAAGFSDQSHFSRTFKRLTGYTPRDFRRASRTR